MGFDMGSSWNLTEAGGRDDFLTPGVTSSDEADTDALCVIEADREGGGASAADDVARERVAAGASSVKAGLDSLRTVEDDRAGGGAIDADEVARERATGGPSSVEPDLDPLRAVEADRDSGGPTAVTEVVRERVTGGRSSLRKFGARSGSRGGGYCIGPTTEGGPTDTRGFARETLGRISVSENEAASPYSCCRSRISRRSWSFSSSRSATERPLNCPTAGFVFVVEPEDDEFLLRIVAESERYPEFSRWR